MRKEDKEKALSEAAKQRAGRGTTPDFKPFALKPLDKTSRQLPRVKLVRGSQQEQDNIATQALIKVWSTPDGYQCPRCPYTTTNTDDFLEHMEAEINKAMEHIDRMAKR